MGVVLKHLCYEEQFLQWVEKESKKELSSSTHNTEECAYKDALHHAQVLEYCIQGILPFHAFAGVASQCGLHKKIW